MLLRLHLACESGMIGTDRWKRTPRALKAQVRRCDCGNVGAETSYADAEDIGSQGAFGPGAIQPGCWGSTPGVVIQQLIYS